MPPCLYLFTGISFAGKSVLARRLAAHLGVPRVDPDEVSHRLGLGLSGEFLSDAQWARIHAMAEDEACTYLRSGTSVVYDTTAFARAQRDALRDLATRYGATVLLIFVDTRVTSRGNAGTPMNNLPGAPACTPMTSPWWRTASSRSAVTKVRSVSRQKTMSTRGSLLASPQADFRDFAAFHKRDQVSVFVLPLERQNERHWLNWRLQKPMPFVKCFGMFGDRVY